MTCWAGKGKDEEGTHRQSSLYEEQQETTNEQECWEAGIGPIVFSPMPRSLSAPTKGMVRAPWVLNLHTVSGDGGL